MATISNHPQSEEEPKNHEFDDEEEEEENEDEELEGWDDWEAEDEAGEDGDDESSDSNLLCLFCDSRYGSCDALFDHCISSHHFDFRGVRTKLGLDFYGGFKLINYVRSQVGLLFHLSFCLVAENLSAKWKYVYEKLGLCKLTLKISYFVVSLSTFSQH